MQSKKAGSGIRQLSEANHLAHNSMNAAAPNIPDQAMDSVDTNVTESVEGTSLGTQPQATPGHLPTQTAGDADFNTVIADIINHGETVDNHYASRGYNTIGLVHNGYLGASFNLKIQSLPVLENLVGLYGKVGECEY